MIFKSEENHQRVLDAQKRGIETVRKNLENKKLEYYKNPKLCLHCQKPILYEKRKNNYCCNSCGKFGNINGLKPLRFCLNCGCIMIKKGKIKFCSSECSSDYRSRKSFESNLIKFNSGKLNDSSARIFFVKLHPNEKLCSICGLTEWMGKPIPLCVDHIDGDHNNNFPSNLRFVCNNCDAQLPTYKGANKGHGRTARREKARSDKIEWLNV